MKSQLPSPAVCRAGGARVDLTPPVGVSLAGYFHDRVAESVRDKLFAHALVVESRGTRVALVSCDLISLDAATAAPAKERIERETGIPPDHVLICATHTHTGPELRAKAVVPTSPEYVATLPDRIAEAVVRAAADPSEVTVHAGRTELHGYSFNRLFRLRDGTERFGRVEGQTIREAGPIDPELQTLSLVDAEGRLRGMVVNFALHADVIGGGGARFVSADWPGMVARNLRALCGRQLVTVFLQGTCGDINHVSPTPTHLPTKGPRKAEQLGRAVAGAALVAAGRAEPMTEVPLAAATETLAIPYYTRDEAFRQELAALKAKPNPTDFDRYVIERGESWPHDGQTAEVPVQAMRLGDVGLAALPAEVFVRLGLEIKHFSPAMQTFVVELANARSSTYVPTTDQAYRGAYGARPILSRHLCADAGRRMADAAQRLLWRLWEETGTGESVRGQTDQ